MVDLVPKVKRTDAIQCFVSQETPIVTHHRCRRRGRHRLQLHDRHRRLVGDAACWPTISRPALIGRDADEIEAIWRDLLFAHPRHDGRRDHRDRAGGDRHGAVGPARRKSRTCRCWQLAGGAQGQLPLYTTEGGWLHIETAALVDDALRAPRPRAFAAPRSRSARPHGREDVARLSAVREAVGDGFEIMTDCQPGLFRRRGDPPRRAPTRSSTSPGSRSRCRPTTSTAMSGCRDSTSTPIAVGEVLYTRSAISANICRRGACSIVQVDVGRIGGITPWLKVAHVAEAFNIAVCPHFLMELHVSLCCAVPNGRYVEYIPQLDDHSFPHAIRDGMAVPSEHAGSRYRVGFWRDRAHVAGGRGCIR